MMTRKSSLRLVAVLLVAAVGLASPALAADAPKWVALVHVAAQNAVGLRWLAVPGATSYKVLRSQAAGKDYQEIYSGAQPQFFDKDVEPAETYYYVLQSVDAAGPSENSEERSLLIPGEKRRKLNPPEWDQFGLTETTEFGKTSYKVGLSWKKSDNPDVVAYNLYRSTTKGKDYQLVWSGAETKYVDAANIEEGKTYYYTLSALDNTFQESKLSPEKEQFVKKAEKKAVKRAEVKNTINAKASRVVFRIPKTAEEPRMGMPTDMAMDREAGLLYLVSQSPNAIFVYDERGEFKNQFGSSGIMEGQFGLPSGIALDVDGNVYVSDLARKKVLVFDSQGKFRREFDAGQKCDPEKDPDPVQPVGVAVGPEGRIFVTDNENGHVMVFGADGKRLSCFGEQATKQDRGLGFLSKPSFIVFDADQRLHLQDYGPSRTQVFDKEGTPLFSTGEFVKGLVGAYVKVGKPCPDAAHKIIWGLDSAMGNIQGFDWETGEYKLTLAGEDKKLKFNERAEWDLTSTRVMEIDADGRFWVLEGLGRAIVVLEAIDPIE